jgi:hypothetical protein
MSYNKSIKKEDKNMAQMKYSDNMTQVRRVDAELQNELKKYLHPSFPAQVQLRVKIEGKHEILEMVVFGNQDKSVDTMLVCDSQKKGIIESYIYGLSFEGLKKDMIKNYIHYIVSINNSLGNANK